MEMHIEVRNHYIGLDSNNEMIYPGFYEVGDSRLHGLEQSLVDLGYAYFIPGTEKQPADPYKGMNVADLRMLAEKHKVDLGEATKRDDIIAKLTEADVVPEE
jgi:hypothetical protein